MRLWPRVLGVTAALVLFIGLLSLSGCVSQQADLKTTERQLQKSIKLSNEEMAQRSAQQRQELEEIKGQDLPRLRGELDRTVHQLQELGTKQQDLKFRVEQLERSTGRVGFASDSDPTSAKALNMPHTDSRIDSLDEVVSRLMVRIEELQKRVQTLEKR